MDFGWGFFIKRSMIVVAALLCCSVAAFGLEKRHNIPIGDSPQLGPASAAVTIIEFIDFQ